jgi:alanine racemase
LGSSETLVSDRNARISPTMETPPRAGDLDLARVPASATGVIIVDLGQIRANWRALAQRVAPAECAAVVKADAYGLGAAQVIPALVKEGCRTFFVATIGEAARARILAPKAAIYILDGLLPGTGPEFLAIGAIPVLASFEEVKEWEALALARGERLPTALHVDSGLNRLGMTGVDMNAIDTEERARHLDVRLIVSHLACADNPGHDMNAWQRDNFDAMRRYMPNVPASLVASDGLMLGVDYHYDLVRPGYALYGGQAFQGGPAPVAPVLAVKARVLQVRVVQPSDTVGYSATWRPKGPSRIAIVAAGYDDGVARALSRGTGEDGAHVMFEGKLAPIVGRVSMDLITVDVTKLEQPPARGDFVDLIGPGLPIETIGAAAGTIGYEVLTRLGRRFHRLYRGG